MEKMKALVAELGLERTVIFKGKMSPEELWPFLSGCDVFVFPTLSEGFPNAVLEAMACGLPVISSDFAGVDDLVRSEKNGLIFSKKDFRGLAEKIKFVYENDKYRNEVAGFNRSYVENFSWDNFISGFEKALEKATRERSRT